MKIQRQPRYEAQSEALPVLKRASEFLKIAALEQLPGWEWVYLTEEQDSAHQSPWSTAARTVASNPALLSSEDFAPSSDMTKPHRSNAEFVLDVFQCQAPVERERLELFSHVGDEIYGDRDIMLRAVRICGRALGRATLNLLQDAAFIKSALETNGLALAALDPNLKDRPWSGKKSWKECTLFAVKQNGLALEYAQNLRGDEETILAAVKSCAWSLQFAFYCFDAVADCNANVELNFTAEYIWAGVGSIRVYGGRVYGGYLGRSGIYKPGTKPPAFVLAAVERCGGWIRSSQLTDAAQVEANREEHCERGGAGASLDYTKHPIFDRSIVIAALRDDPTTLDVFREKLINPLAASQRYLNMKAGRKKQMMDDDWKWQKFRDSGLYDVFSDAKDFTDAVTQAEEHLAVQKELKRKPAWVRRWGFVHKSSTCPPHGLVRADDAPPQYVDADEQALVEDIVYEWICPRVTMNPWRRIFDTHYVFPGTAAPLSRAALCRAQGRSMRDIKAEHAKVERDQRTGRSTRTGAASKVMKKTIPKSKGTAKGKAKSTAKPKAPPKAKSIANAAPEAKSAAKTEGTKAPAQKKRSAANATDDLERALEASRSDVAMSEEEQLAFALKLSRQEEEANAAKRRKVVKNAAGVGDEEDDLLDDDK